MDAVAPSAFLLALASRANTHLFDRLLVPALIVGRCQGARAQIRNYNSGALHGSRLAWLRTIEMKEPDSRARHIVLEHPPALPGRWSLARPSGRAIVLISSALCGLDLGKGR